MIRHTTTWKFNEAIGMQRIEGLHVSILTYELAGFARVLWFHKRIRDAA